MAMTKRKSKNKIDATTDVVCVRARVCCCKYFSLSDCPDCSVSFENYFASDATNKHWSLSWSGQIIVDEVRKCLRKRMHKHKRPFVLCCFIAWSCLLVNATIWIGGRKQDEDQTKWRKNEW